MDLKEEQVLGADINRHWYYVAKARLLAARIGKAGTVLDVGAGSGFFSRWLLSNGLAERAICVDPLYESERDESEGGRPISFRRSVQTCDADLLVMMDVLEHVEDDRALLDQYMALLQPGARCFITVPAFQFLWSSHDVFLEHKRRYTLARLVRTVKAVGGADVRAHYFYGAVFPIAASARLMQRGKPAAGSDLRKHSPAVNAVLSCVCDLERRISRWNRLAGLSVALTCEAPTRAKSRLAA